MKLSFDGKTVLVTGAAHGFGRAISLAFAERGASVWACDVLAEELAETRKQCQDAGGVCHTSAVDVTNEAQVRDFVTEAEASTNRLDILVNNAGGVLGQVGRPVEEVSAEDWQRIYDVNVTGAFYFAKAVAPAMKHKEAGRIVTISSGAGLGVSLTGIQAYASAKAALISLTRQLAHELGPWGITVNSVAPGFVRSNPTTEKQWQAYSKEGQEKLLESIALRRLGTVKDIAHSVLFFTSDYAGWISGQVLSVDGGK